MKSNITNPSEKHLEQAKKIKTFIDEMQALLIELSGDYESSDLLPVMKLLAQDLNDTQLDVARSLLLKCPEAKQSIIKALATKH